MSQASICIPTYNGAAFINQALQSIINQTCRTFELVVSDDDSTDGTLTHVERVRDPRLRWGSNRQRLGLVGNWNRCMEIASHDLICLFHQDDEMLPNNIEKKIEFLDRNPEVGFVFSDMHSIDAEGAIIAGHWSPQHLPASNMIFSGADFFREQLQHGNLVSCPTVMARRKLLLQLGGFNPQLRFTPDLHIWLRLSLYADVGYLADPLVNVRRHDNQESNHFLGSVSEIKEVWRAIDLVFTEHEAQLPNIANLYSIALSHLRRWAYIQTRSAVRARRIRAALSYASICGELVWRRHPKNQPQ